MKRIAEIVATKDRLCAFMEMAGWFQKCGEADRIAIIAAWPFNAEWQYPSPWKLAWPDGTGYSSEERIMALLTYYCIEGVGPDNRDAVFAFAVVHNAALLAGLNPHALFAKARALADSNVALSIDAFMGMSDEEKSMDAFMLKVVHGPDGQPQLSVSI
jgi:hypothetical protein